MMRRRRKYIEPIPTDTMSDEEREALIDSGQWRVFEVDGDEYIVQKRNPPTFKGQRQPGLPAPPMPRVTTSLYNGKRIYVVAWPYSTTTVQDFDSLRRQSIPRNFRSDYAKAPANLSNLPGLFAYSWTDSGLHIYQHGKRPLLKGHDEAYERISREMKGWYGDRIRSRDETEARVLVTNDEQAARVWLQAGGKVRLVKDLARSYAVSKKRRGYL